MNNTESNAVVNKMIAELAEKAKQLIIKNSEGFDHQLSELPTWGDAKDFICAMSQVIEQQYMPPMRTPGDKRAYNKTIKRIKSRL